MRRIFAMLFACLFLMSGCSSKELEEQALIVSMGIDLTDDNKIEITVKTPGSTAASSSSSSSSEQSEDDTYQVTGVTGDDFSGVFSLLYAVMSRSVNFSQMREVVVGEKMAESEQFTVMIKSLSNIKKIRQLAYIMCCKGKAKDYIQKQQPTVGTRLSKYIDQSISISIQEGVIPNATVGLMIRDFKNGWSDPTLIYAAVNDEKKKEKKQEPNTLDVLAGEIPYSGKNKVEMMGMALTDGIHVSGYLTGYEAQWLHLLTASGGTLMIESDGIPIGLSQRWPKKLGILEKDGQITLEVHINVACVYPPDKTPDKDKIKDALEKEIKSVLQKCQACSSDPLGFGEYAVRRFATVKEWENWNWRKKYKTAEISVKVYPHLRSER